MRKRQIKWILACVIAAMAVAVLSKARLANWPTATGAAVGAAAITAGAGIAQERMKSVIAGQDARKEKMSEGIYMPGGRLPRARQLADAIAIGLHPAPRYQPSSAARSNRLPEYVPRDVDAVLCQALAESGFILLVGAAAAGKTRTAFEAVRRVLPGHFFIVPSAARYFGTAVKLAQDLDKCVLWLDDLQSFFGDNEGVSLKSIAELTGAPGRHRVVLATMRAADESRLIGGDAEGGDKLVSASRSVLDLAEPRIFLERLLSDGEKAGAETVARRDPRVADALSHAGVHGLGEYLACGPQLYNQWESAWTVRGQSRAAAILAAAVDCRRAGFTAPLPRSLLETLHEGYLAERGGAWLGPEMLEEAWASLVRVRDSGSAPLQLVNDGHYDVFAYLVDEFQRREGGIAPEATARAALSAADSAMAANIAMTARGQRRYRLAEDALHTQYAAVSTAAGPDALLSLLVRANLAVVLHDQHKWNAAEREYAEVLPALARRPGADQREVLRVRANFAGLLLGRERFAAAGTEYEGVLASLTALPDLGQADQEDVLMVRGNLAGALFGQNRFDEAEKEYRAVVAARTVRLGPDHPATLISRSNLGLLLMRRGIVESNPGFLDAAEAEMRSVLEIRDRMLGPDHPHTHISRENLDTLLGYRSVG